MPKVILSLCLSIALLGLSAFEGQAQTIERIKESGTIKIGYRTDAAPHSFKNSIGEPAGFSVGLCKAVAAHMKKDLGMAEISIDYVPVTSQNRFDAVQNGEIDLLCGSATATLSRRELVDFSLPIFLDGASVMTLKGGAKGFEDLKGQTIGVLANTTTEDRLRQLNSASGTNAAVTTVASHQDGIAKLEQGEVAAYFSDQSILLYLALTSNDPTLFTVSKKLFSHEPYALALKRGDSNFRLAVDRALSRIYRSALIEEIFIASFGEAQPSDLLRGLYLSNALPE